MTKEQRIALLRHALKGVLALVAEDCVREGRPADPRVAECRSAIRATEPETVEEEPTAISRECSDLPHRSSRI
jgi:hypothetical protein